MRAMYLTFLENPENRKLVAEWPLTHAWNHDQPKHKLLLEIGAILPGGAVDPMAEEFIVAAAWSSIGLEPPEIQVEEQDLVQVPYTLRVNGRSFSGEFTVLPSEVDVLAIRPIVPQLGEQALREHKMSPRPGLLVGLDVELGGTPHSFEHRF